MEQQRNASTAPAVQLPPILIIDHQSRSPGRRLFEELNTEEFSTQATACREAHGQSSKHHAGHWQAIATAAWKALTDDEQDDWEQKATMARSSVVGNIYEYVVLILCSVFLIFVIVETRRLSVCPCSSFLSPTLAQALDRSEMPHFIFSMVSVVNLMSWNLEGTPSSLPH